MEGLTEIEERMLALGQDADCRAAAAELLALGEGVLEHWITARGENPTTAAREGFRLLALHRQGAKGEPSFNACRESCRELVFRYNVIQLTPEAEDVGDDLRLMAAVALHIYLFVSGKLQDAELGDFCCSSRPARSAGL